MSDRRSEKLYVDTTGATDLSDNHRFTEASPADLLAAVRRGVESGTIKGEVRRYCEKHEALVGAIPHLCNVANWVIDGGGSPTDCRINDALVVSDGGGSCDGSGTCEATDHIEGCYRSTYVRPVSDGGSET